MSEQKLQLKKARVPFKIILKLSLKNMWKKKFRFLVMMLICGISLGLLSFTIELNGDKLRQNVYTMIENGYRYTDIKNHVPVPKEIEEADYYNKYNAGELPKDSYDKIKSALPDLTLHRYAEVSINYAKQNIENSFFFYPGVIETLILFDDKNDYNLLCGRLPDPASKEILITDYLATAFTYFNVIPECETYVDYLNKFFNLNNQQDYRIVGVIETNYKKWAKFSNSQITSIDETNKDNYSFETDFKMFNAIVITEGYYEMEKTSSVSRLKFSSTGNDGFDWSITNNNNGMANDYGTFYIQSNNVTIAHKGYNVYGRMPMEENEIVIPTSWIPYLFKDIYGSNLNYTNSASWYFTNYWHGYYYGIPAINGAIVTLKIEKVVNGTTYTYENDYKIVGLGDDLATAQVYRTDLATIHESFAIYDEQVIVELPNSSEKALAIFNKAYEAGYILNVWPYRSDIDNFEVDPFIDIVSKAGLFVFAIFTIGIMWTIISIEIVDSKKEIGILRSIGLNGIQVSLIFIIQVLIVNLLAYGLAILLASYAIPWYNSGLHDELGKITLYMYTMTYRTPVYLIIFVLAITFVSTIIPLYQIMSQKIIDVINERDDESGKKKRKQKAHIK